MSEQTNFPYTISVTAPSKYPVEVYLGYLSDGEEFVSAIPKTGPEFQGWTSTGAGGGMGASQMPSFLELTWISYAEKKFWKVEANLPKEKILHYFREGFSILDVPQSGPRVHSTYDELVIGVAPGGVVVVWLKGSIKRVEIGRYQAKDTVVDKNDFAPNPDLEETQEAFFDWCYNHFTDSTTKEIIEKGALPYGVWEEYRTKYNWQYNTMFYKPDVDDTQYFTYFNGEADVFYKDEVERKRPSLQAIPYRVELIFRGNNADVEFDETEIRAAFKELTKDNLQEPLEVVGKVGFMYKDMTFSVKSKKKEIPLLKTKVMLYNN